ASTYRQMQHRPISDSLSGRRLRCVEQGLNLVPVEMPNQARIGSLERDRKDAADLFERCRFAMLQETKEGSNGCQADVARLRRGAGSGGHAGRLRYEGRSSSWLLPRQEPLAGGGDIREQLGGGLQIPVGRIDVRVPEIGRQCHHVLSDALTTRRRRL